MVALAVAFVTAVGVGLAFGAASSSVERPVLTQAKQEQPVKHAVLAYTTSGGDSWYKCLAWQGWGFVSVGATVSTATVPWFVAAGLDAGMTWQKANTACGWGTQLDHIGYTAFCGARFLYISPTSGRAVYDDRDAIHACEIPPEALDDLFCNYFHGADYATCLNQLLFDYAESYAKYGAPLYVGSGAGGGGGGVW